MSLKNFFNPQSVAIVGASEKEGKIGYVITKNLLDLGYKKKVFLVNPKHEKILEKKCFKKLEDIEDEIDLAIIVIPARFVVEVIKSARKKVKNFIIISAGFSEIGSEGKERAKQLKKIIQKNNLNILGPNCLGFVNPKIKLNASFAGGMPPEGKIALISQSGALMVAIMDMAQSENLGFSKIISIGNKLQLNEINLLEYLNKDEDTEIIAFYLEGIKKGKSFLNLAQKIIKNKPIVILKSGRSEKAQKAISLHTGALAGSDDIVNAAFQQEGIWRAKTIEEFIKILSAVNLKNKINDNKIIIVTNAGGPGVLTADAFLGKHIELAEISSETKLKLKKFLPQESSLENPIDLLGDASTERYKQSLEILIKEKPGAILAVLTPQDQTPVLEIAQLIIDFNKEYEVPIIPIFIGKEKLIEARKLFHKEKILNFTYPDIAVKIVDYYTKRKSRNNISEREKLINYYRQEKNKIILGNAKREKRKALYYEEGKRILNSYGIKVANFYENIEAVKKFPVVVKVDSPYILHKTDKKGVILNVNNFLELKRTFNKLKNKFPQEKIIIQHQRKIQEEIILGIKRDASFGNIVIVGLGGIYTEILKQVEFFISPVSKQFIKKKLKTGSLKFLFKKTRGRKPYDINELAQIIENFSILALELEEEIEQMDINPLLIYNNNQKAVAVDVKFLLKD